MAGLQGSDASYVADMVSRAKAAAIASGTEEDEDKERPRGTARRDAWP
jgi:hypothetical protein